MLEAQKNFWVYFCYTHDLRLVFLLEPVAILDLAFKELAVVCKRKTLELWDVISSLSWTGFISTTVCLEPRTKQPLARHSSNTSPRQAVARANLRYLNFKFLTGFVYHGIFFAVALKFRLVFLYGRQLFFIELHFDVRPTIWWLVVWKWLFWQTLYLYNWMFIWKFLMALVICY